MVEERSIGPLGVCDCKFVAIGNQLFGPQDPYKWSLWDHENRLKDKIRVTSRVKVKTIFYSSKVS